MSKEKLYAVKNDEGEWMSLDGPQTEIWYSNNPTLFKDKSYAEDQSMGCKAHVVELVEPEKADLTKEQAEIVERARDKTYPATYISNESDSEASDEEELLMKAYVNGYTLAKEKKYVVYKELGGKQDKDNPMEYVQACRSPYHPETMFWVLTTWIINDKSTRLTKKEITDFGLQDCKKEEATDDGTY